MNKTLNLENAKSKIELKTRTDIRLDILEEKVAKLEKVVFKELTEASGPADEEVRIIILGNIDRELYAKVCELCLSEDDVNVIYEKGNKEEARACFQNEMKPVAIYEYLESAYDLSIRTANCLTCEYQRLYNTLQAPKAKLEWWLRSLVESNGEKLAKVRNIGRKSFKEVMDKVGNAK